MDYLYYAITLRMRFTARGNYTDKMIFRQIAMKTYLLYFFKMFANYDHFRDNHSPTYYLTYECFNYLNNTLILW